MKLRLTGNTWVLVVLFGIIVVVGSETARAYLRGGLPGDEQQAKTPPKTEFDPPFKKGDPAPDFSLPGKDGKLRSLSELVKRDTMLCFICGCNRCRTTQNYLALLLSKMGDKAPDVVAVSTTDPASEAAYKRDVHLKQTMLYDGRDPGGAATHATPIMELYKGHPCPRIFRIGKDRRVEWISSSPAMMLQAELHMLELAQALGFKMPGDAHQGGLIAPPPPAMQMAPHPKQPPAKS